MTVVLSDYALQMTHDTLHKKLVDALCRWYLQTFVGLSLGEVTSQVVQPSATNDHIPDIGRERSKANHAIEYIPKSTHSRC